MLNPHLSPAIAACEGEIVRESVPRRHSARSTGKPRSHKLGYLACTNPHVYKDCAPVSISRCGNRYPALVVLLHHEIHTLLLECIGVLRHFLLLLYQWPRCAGP